MARPSRYAPKLVAAICERLADGQSLREICRADDMPAKSTVLKWLGEHKEFSDQYARAREAQADHWAEEIVEISDDGTNDWTTRQRGDEEVEVVDQEHIQRSRLRVDTRKWLMARMAPKKYGEKLTQELTGKDGAALLAGITVNFVKPDGSS